MIRLVPRCLVKREVFRKVNTLYVSRQRPCQNDVKNAKRRLITNDGGYPVEIKSANNQTLQDSAKQIETQILSGNLNRL